MAARALLLAFVLSGLSANASASDDILPWCERQHPGDYELIEYCLGNQTQAMQNVTTLIDQASENAPIRGIHQRCEQQYRGDQGTDWELVHYCLENQAAAYERLYGRSPLTAE